MDVERLGTLGLVTLTFSMPLLALIADELRGHRHDRRPGPSRERLTRQTRNQAHPMANLRRD